MALSLQYWANYTAGKPKIQRKSEDAVASNHVLKFTFDTELKAVKAVVQASYRNKSYSIEVFLNDSYGIVDSSCECPLRHFECHHVAAALLFGYKNVAKTDLPCSWLKNPKSRMPKTVRTMEDTYPTKKPDYRALGRPVTQADRDFMYAELSSLGRFTAMHWIMSPEPMKELPLPVCLVEDLLVSREYLETQTRASWLRRSLLLNETAIRKVERLTVGQRNNQHWSMIRKLRITASNFGQVLAAIKRNRFPPSLKNRLVAAYNLTTVTAVIWGINHEVEAVKVYCREGAVVQETGLWLHESGVLGASPDGLVTSGPLSQVHLQSLDAAMLQPELLEVKCPYSARECTVMEAVSSIKDFYLELKDGSLVLKETHDYYHQIQGQLYIAGKSCCDLVVWTPQDAEIIRIAKDVSWAANISNLIEFYFHKFIPSFD